MICIFFCLQFFFSSLLFSCEKPLSPLFELVLLRIMNNTGLAYRVSTVHCIKKCKSYDKPFCPAHQKIRPVAILSSRNQKMLQEELLLDYKKLSTQRSIMQGSLLLENLMNPDDYLIIYLKQRCNYATKNAEFSSG
ncbi:hypothetical protein BH09DEP1_BH09DEP1_1010 [soil metagenome]